MRVACSIVVTLFLTVVQSLCVSAQDTGEYEKRKARLEKEIEMLDRQLDETVSRSRSELSRRGR